jgi:hypothetical protein
MPIKISRCTGSTARVGEGYCLMGRARVKRAVYKQTLPLEELFSSKTPVEMSERRSNPSVKMVLYFGLGAWISYPYLISPQKLEQ